MRVYLSLARHLFPDVDSFLFGHFSWFFVAFGFWVMGEGWHGRGGGESDNDDDDDDKRRLLTH